MELDGVDHDASTEARGEARHGVGRHDRGTGEPVAILAALLRRGAGIHDGLGDTAGERGIVCHAHLGRAEAAERTHRGVVQAGATYDRLDRLAERGAQTGRLFEHAEGALGDLAALDLTENCDASHYATTFFSSRNATS